jgi:hypothetical protein
VRRGAERHAAGLEDLPTGRHRTTHPDHAVGRSLSKAAAITRLANIRPARA